ncbi:MAG TPA: hypothetical protein VFO68_33535, partial [Actinophytocola sp.]|nr:hypothetical protein [Actinophytocola sp.]
PDKTTMVPGYLPDRYVGQDCVRRMTDEFWRRLTSEGFVLDLRSALRTWAERIGRPVYPPLDAHWGDEGGLVMAQAMAEELRPGISDSWVISPGAPWLVPGDLPPLIGRKGDISGRYYAISPGGLADQTRNLPSDFTHPMQLNTASGPGTIAEPVGLLADSFTIRALRYLAAAFSDLTVLHYKNSEQDRGREAGEMLASKDVVAVELVERTVVSGNSVMLKPDVVDGIVSVLSQRPRR